MSEKRVVSSSKTRKAFCASTGFLAGLVFWCLLQIACITSAHPVPVGNVNVFRIWSLDPFHVSLFGCATSIVLLVVSPLAANRNTRLLRTVRTSNTNGVARLILISFFLLFNILLFFLLVVRAALVLD